MSEMEQPPENSGNEGESPPPSSFEPEQINRLISTIRKTYLDQRDGPSSRTATDSLEARVQAALRRITGSNLPDLSNPENVRAIIEKSLAGDLDLPADETDIVSSGVTPRQIFSGYFHVSLPDIRKRITGLSPELPNTEVDNFQADKNVLMQTLNDLASNLQQSELPKARIDLLFNTVIEQIRRLNNEAEPDEYTGVIPITGDERLYPPKSDSVDGEQAAINYVIITQHIDNMHSTWDALDEFINDEDVLQEVPEFFDELNRQVAVFVRQYPDLLTKKIEGNFKINDLTNWLTDYPARMKGYIDAGTPSALQIVVSEARNLKRYVEMARTKIAPVDPDADTDLEAIARILDDITTVKL